MSRSEDGDQDEFTTPVSKMSRPALPLKRVRDDRPDPDAGEDDGPAVSSSPQLTPRRLDMDAADQTTLACTEPLSGDEEVEATQKYESEPEEGEIVMRGEEQQPVLFARTLSEAL